MNRYDSYKDSGVNWIGEIPSDWVSTKLNRYVFFQEGPGLRTFQFTDEGTKVICVTNITESGIDFTYKKFISTEEYLEKYQHFTVQKGDLLLSSSGNSWGKVSEYLDDEKVMLNTSTIRLNSLDEGLMNKNLIKHLLKSDLVRIQLDILMTGSCQPNFGPSHLNQLLIPIPPFHEQQQIVSFLDTKTSLIDSLIEKTQKKIELLKEQRTSLINEVVTKGLNPNVEMKDTGVEWIGEIPSHWDESQFKYFIKLRHGHQFRDNDFTDNGIKIIKITQLDKNGYLNISNCSMIDENRIEEFEDVLVKENDILMCLTGGTIGKIIKVGKVDEPLLQNYSVGHFSSIERDSMDNDYIFYLMSSEVIVGQIFFDVRETGQPNIGMEDMNRMRICIPPINEQQQIVEYLDEKTHLIDSTISIEENRIEYLKEYRQSLISEVVTGKIKVTD